MMFAIFRNKPSNPIAFIPDVWIRGLQRPRTFGHGARGDDEKRDSFVNPVVRLS
jgi:hypothetical protein